MSLCQWAVLPLVDNYDEDKYEYELHVYTGVKAKSGTDSRIGFVLAGSESDTGIRKLADGKRQVGVPANFQSDVISFVTNVR